MDVGSGRVPVEGSTRTAPDGEDLGQVSPDETLAVTVLLRPRPSPGAPGAVVAADQTSASVRPKHLTRAELLETLGSATEDVDAVRRLAAEHELTVSRVDRAARTVELSGTALQMAAAFSVELRSYRTDAGTVRGRSGDVYVPDWLAPSVVGVLGLDTRPQARPHFRLAGGGSGTAFRPAAAPTQSYTPVELAELYDFPPGSGAGQTIGVIELGGGYTDADLAHYLAGLGVSPAPQVSSVGVDGATNAPGGGPDSADGEVVLDIEVCGAVAPAAEIVVYFAPNTDKGFLDAVNAAIHDAEHEVSVISISWGGPESTWTAQALDAMDAAFTAAAAIGISVFCASGDNGSSDAVTDGLAHADFPASSPHAVACGGTTLRASGGSIASETVWNSSGATGGGVSDHFAVPDYQSSIAPVSANPGGRTGRGVPDIAADADPQTGYQVYLDGQSLVFGGTSAVAPLWAGLTARLQQLVGQKLAPLQPRLYADVTALRDVVEGDNGAYRAGPGWDACTGLGSPDGQALLDALSS